MGAKLRAAGSKASTDQLIAVTEKLRHEQVHISHSHALVRAHAPSDTCAHSTDLRFDQARIRSQQKISDSFLERFQLSESEALPDPSHPYPLSPPPRVHSRASSAAQIAALHAESLSERFFVALERASSIHESTKTLLVEGDGFSRVRYPTGNDLSWLGWI